MNTIDGIAESILEKYKESLVMMNFEGYDEYIRLPYHEKYTCRNCGAIGPEVLNKYLDGGGPGQFWIMNCRCKSCGHTSEDAYCDADEWRTASFDEWRNARSN